MPTKEEKQAAKEAIADHLAVHGNKHWSLTKDKHPNINTRTWWRYVEKSSGGTVPAPKEHLEKSKEFLLSEAANHLPVAVAPAPATLAKTGDEGKRAIDVLNKFTELYNDAELLRNYSTDKKGVITKPQVYSESIKHRRELLTAMVKSAEVLWELRRIQDYYDLILEAIKDVTPEAARKIADNLGALDKKHGMTINGKF